MKIKCPFDAEFGKWIDCPCKEDKYCDDIEEVGSRDSWCGEMVGKAMLSHKIWIGNDY